MTADRRPPPHRHLLAALCLACMAGCASSPPPRTLVVVPSLPVSEGASPALSKPTSEPANADRPSATPAVMQVVVPVVSVPEQLQHRAVRYQGDQAALMAWPDAIWAERIEVGMTRRLSQALHQAMPASGWWSHDDERAQARLLVDIQQLDIDPARGRLSAVASWRLLSRQGVTLASGATRSHRAVVVHGATEQASVMGEWVDELARAIAAQLPPAALNPQ